jgi:hypothetical protein
MVKRNKRILLTATCLFALIFAGLLATPKVSAAIRATFVEVVIPSSPFYGKIALNHQPLASSIGPDAGTLGVTNITVTNFDDVKAQVLIGQPLFAPDGSCGSFITGQTALTFSTFIEPLSTQTITYPTPLVFVPVQGHSCIAGQTNAHVEIYVNGFVN